MSKPFIPYSSQISKLRHDKKLIIVNDDVAVSSLQNIGYYALIGGYKHPFINAHTRRYENGTRFEDIVALYFSMRNYVAYFLNIYAVLSEEFVR